ncbi:MAG: sigma-54 dependent transcriptional regulator [Myxococcota bacterium]
MRCLVVDDEPAILETIRRGTAHLDGLDLTLINRGDLAIQALQAEDSFDLVLSDVRMPGASGHEVLRRVRQLSPDIPVLLMSAVATVDEILQLQNAGATLFLRKPFGLPELQLMLRHAQHLARQLRTARDLNRVAPADEVTLPGLVGRSPAFKRALVHLAALARTDAPLLIGGETGTGKELVARAAHKLSPRKDAPFMAVNCSALTDTLVDSELFGHEKGAFTGALKDSPGLFRAANGGTIFLDEIGDLSASGQAKLLRVLQEREIRPVGATHSVKVNVRVIAATHRDLAQMVAAGQFRQDLLYRLKVGEVTLPPLRKRPDDILLLAHTFLEKCRKEFGAAATAFSPEAVTAMMAYGWPGNVRELEATVTRAAAVAAGAAVTAEDLGLAASPGGSAPSLSAGMLPAFSEAKQQTIDAFERAYLTRLVAEQPAVTLAAQQAGMDRKSLYRLLKKHGLSAHGAEEE